MGRTVPSFRNVIEMEKQEWKSFRNALDKSERKEFDKMWDIPRLYVSACSNSCQLVPFHPIAMSILFHHYKELLECEKQINELLDSTGVNQAKHGLQNDMETEDSQIEQEQQLLPLFDF